MNDRELIERAAKAAGLTDMKWIGSVGLVKMLDPSRPQTTGSIGAAWNPLEDDGDAFRLMVYLGMEVSAPCMRLDDDQAEAKDYDNNFVCIELADEGHNGDPMAATRRAIVRAAAVIRGEA